MEIMFKPVDWCLRANLYEVNVRQYSKEGTFRAFQPHIPRLKAMGINVLWFMPITPISVKGRQGSLGSYYACSDYLNTNPEFGTVEDFKALVAEAHRHDMKVIIDWVANHTGQDHVWVNSHPEYYKKNAQGEFYDSNSWLDVYDLNYYDQRLRKDMIAAMRFWVDQCGIDGFRCDMAHLVPLDFWHEARVALDAIRPLFWLAETEAINYDLVFDCIYAWEWMHKTEQYAHQRSSVQQLVETLQKMQRNFPQCFNLFFTANHDENSWNGTEYEKYGELAIPLAVFSATWTGIPLIYSGQELPNKKRLKFFDHDPIQWTGQNALEEFYRKILFLNLEHPALVSGIDAKYQFIPCNDPSVLSYARYNGGKKVVVILNLGENDLSLQLTDPLLNGKFTDVFTEDEILMDGKFHTSLKRYGYIILAN